MFLIVNRHVTLICPQLLHQLVLDKHSCLIQIQEIRFIKDFSETATMVFSGMIIFIHFFKCVLFMITRHHLRVVNTVTAASPSREVTSRPTYHNVCWCHRDAPPANQRVALSPPARNWIPSFQAFLPPSLPPSLPSPPLLLLLQPSLPPPFLPPSSSSSSFTTNLVPTAL